MEVNTLSQMFHFVTTRRACIITLPPPPIVYEAVDLGLPSGTKWATCNVGASKPSEAGLYFQWGDTQGYSADQVGTGDGQKKFASDWSDYKWHLSGDSYDNVAFTKYTTPDAKLELEDDAAHVHMGGDWHMPTKKQFIELINLTSKYFTTSDGVNGVTFRSNKDESKSIFIPMAGGAWNGSLNKIGNVGFIWSPMLYNSNNMYRGLYFQLALGNMTLVFASRYDGFPIRGVIG